MAVFNSSTDGLDLCISFLFVLQVSVAEQGCGVQLLHPHADGIDLWLCEPLASGRVL